MFETRPGGATSENKKTKTHRCIILSSRIVSTRAQQTATILLKIQDPNREGSMKSPSSRIVSGRFQFLVSVQRRHRVRCQGGTGRPEGGEPFCVSSFPFVYFYISFYIIRFSYSILGSATKPLHGCVGGIADFDRHPSCGHNRETLSLYDP